MKDEEDCEFDKLLIAIEKRFPNAQFVVSCFETIDEIENKILSYDDTIIYRDYFLNYNNYPSL
jgi:hypothetical protein